MSAMLPNNDSYEASRAKFCEAAALNGWQQEEHAIAAAGPAGERLTIDIAISPGEHCERAVVISSGLHGVEGPFGAAVQHEILGAAPAIDRSYPGVRFVFIHALNPFGFAWSRRVNEDNVDLNRNFLVSGEEYRGSPDGYRRLDPLLNPKRPPRALDGFYIQAALTVLRDGMPALKQAVAGGQYDFPRGLFFGGAGPSQTQRILHENLRRWVGEVRSVVHLDFHTGLGRWGTFKVLLDEQLTIDQRSAAAGRFGADAVEPTRSDGVAYSARGSLGPWCASVLPEVDYLYACAEFGTYPPLRVLSGLRAENQATHWGAGDRAITMDYRRRLRELFCPPSPDWWRRTLPAAVRLVHEAAAT